MNYISYIYLTFATINKSKLLKEKKRRISCKKHMRNKNKKEKTKEEKYIHVTLK